MSLRDKVNYKILNINPGIDRGTTTEWEIFEERYLEFTSVPKS